MGGLKVSILLWYVVVISFNWAHEEYLVPRKIGWNLRYREARISWISGKRTGHAAGGFAGVKDCGGLVGEREGEEVRCQAPV